MNVLIWGLGKGFWELYNILKANEELGKFEIIGYVSKDAERRSIDKKCVLFPKDIRTYNLKFDYIIVTTDKFYKEIADYGECELAVSRKKFINGKVFKIPHFEWNKYIQIYDKEWSIVADTCIGGVMANALGLPFCSPFVNVRVGIEKNDYYYLIENLDDYMKLSPSKSAKLKYKDIDWNGWECRIDFPKLWYGDVMLHGFHYESQDSFFEIWEKRRKRYNPEYKVILKILYDEEDVQKFQSIPCKRKLGFYYKETDDKNIITVCPKESAVDISYQYGSYVFYYFVNNGEIFTYINIFDFLLNSAGSKGTGNTYVSF